MRPALLLLVIAACGLAPRALHAQRVPFFAPAGTGFDPEISVVNSGELLDAQVVVSDDLKYVTINTRASSSRLLALREFSFANGGNAPPLGFVGGAGANANAAGVLDRRGMTLVARLED